MGSFRGITMFAKNLIIYNKNKYSMGLVCAHLYFKLYRRRR